MLAACSLEPGAPLEPPLELALEPPLELPLELALEPPLELPLEPPLEPPQEPLLEQQTLEPPWSRPRSRSWSSRPWSPPGAAPGAGPGATPGAADPGAPLEPPLEPLLEQQTLEPPLEQQPLEPPWSRPWSRSWSSRPWDHICRIRSWHGTQSGTGRRLEPDQTRHEGVQGLVRQERIQRGVALWIQHPELRIMWRCRQKHREHRCWLGALYHVSRGSYTVRLEGSGVGPEGSAPQFRVRKGAAQWNQEPLRTEILINTSTGVGRAHCATSGPGAPGAAQEGSAHHSPGSRGCGPVEPGTETLIHTSRAHGCRWAHQTWGLVRPVRPRCMLDPTHNHVKIQTDIQGAEERVVGRIM